MRAAPVAVSRYGESDTPCRAAHPLHPEVVCLLSGTAHKLHAGDGSVIWHDQRSFGCGLLPLPDGPRWEVDSVDGVEWWAFMSVNPPSINETAGRHWAKVNPAKRAFQELGRVGALQLANLGLIAWTGPAAAMFLRPALVSVTLEFRTDTRRDPHNYVGTVCKWVVDGMVQGRAWPDDTPDYVRVAEPRIALVREQRPARIVVAVTKG